MARNEQQTVTLVPVQQENGEIVFLEPTVEQAWQELQATPSYAERFVQSCNSPSGGVED